MFVWRNNKRLGIVLIAVGLISALGIASYVYLSSKSKDNKLDTANTENDQVADSGPLPVELGSIVSLRQMYNDKKYSEVLPVAKSMYENSSNPVDFRLAGLGYCVRATKELGGDTSECQTKADSLLNSASGNYKKFLQDSFNGDEDAQL